jgi:hypothetical protein
MPVFGQKIKNRAILSVVFQFIKCSNNKYTIKMVLQDFAEASTFVLENRYRQWIIN